MKINQQSCYAFQVYYSHFALRGSKSLTYCPFKIADKSCVVVMLVMADGNEGEAISDLLNKWLDCPACRCMKSLDMSGETLYNTLQGAS